MKGKLAAAGDDATEWSNGPPSLEERRATLNFIHESLEGKWKLKAKVMASVTVTSGLRWAHEILALEKEGLYDCHYGIKMAKEALGVA